MPVKKVLRSMPAKIMVCGLELELAPFEREMTGKVITSVAGSTLENVINVGVIPRKVVKGDTFTKLESELTKVEAARRRLLGKDYKTSVVNGKVVFRKALGKKNLSATEVKQIKKLAAQRRGIAAAMVKTLNPNDAEVSDKVETIYKNLRGHPEFQKVFKEMKVALNVGKFNPSVEVVKKVKAAMHEALQSDSPWYIKKNIYANLEQVKTLMASYFDTKKQMWEKRNAGITAFGHKGHCRTYRGKIDYDCEYCAEITQFWKDMTTMRNQANQQLSLACEFRHKYKNLTKEEEFKPLQKRLLKEKFDMIQWLEIKGFVAIDEKSFERVEMTNWQKRARNFEGRLYKMGFRTERMENYIVSNYDVSSASDEALKEAGIDDMFAKVPENRAYKKAKHQKKSKCRKHHAKKSDDFWMDAFKEETPATIITVADEVKPRRRLVDRLFKIFESRKNDAEEADVEHVGKYKSLGEMTVFGVGCNFKDTHCEVNIPGHFISPVHLLHEEDDISQYHQFPDIASSKILKTPKQGETIYFVGSDGSLCTSQVSGQLYQQHISKNRLVYGVLSTFETTHDLHSGSPIFDKDQNLISLVTKSRDRKQYTISGISETSGHILGDCFLNLIVNDGQAVYGTEVSNYQNIKNIAIANSNKKPIVGNIVSTFNFESTQRTDLTLTSSNGVELSHLRFGVKNTNCIHSKDKVIVSNNKTYVIQEDKILKTMENGGKGEIWLENVEVSTDGSQIKNFKQEKKTTNSRKRSSKKSKPLSKVSQIISVLSIILAFLIIPVFSSSIRHNHNNKEVSFMDNKGEIVKIHKPSYFGPWVFGDEAYMMYEDNKQCKIKKYVIDATKDSVNTKLNGSLVGLSKDNILMVFDNNTKTLCGAGMYEQRQYFICPTTEVEYKCIFDNLVYTDLVNLIASGVDINKNLIRLNNTNLVKSLIVRTRNSDDNYLHGYQSDKPAKETKAAAAVKIDTQQQPISELSMDEKIKKNIKKLVARIADENKRSFAENLYMTYFKKFSKNVGEGIFQIMFSIKNEEEFIVPITKAMFKQCDCAGGFMWFAGSCVRISKNDSLTCSSSNLGSCVLGDQVITDQRVKKHVAKLTDLTDVCSLMYVFGNLYDDFKNFVIYKDRLVFEIAGEESFLGSLNPIYEDFCQLADREVDDYEVVKSDHNSAIKFACKSTSSEKQKTDKFYHEYFQTQWLVFYIIVSILSLIYMGFADFILISVVFVFTYIVFVYEHIGLNCFKVIISHIMLAALTVSSLTLFNVKFTVVLILMMNWGVSYVTCDCLPEGLTYTVNGQKNQDSIVYVATMNIMEGTCVRMGNSTLEIESMVAPIPYIYQYTSFKNIHMDRQDIQWSCEANTNPSLGGKCAIGEVRDLFMPLELYHSCVWSPLHCAKCQGEGTVGAKYCIVGNNKCNVYKTPAHGIDRYLNVKFHHGGNTEAFTVALGADKYVSNGLMSITNFNDLTPDTPEVVIACQKTTYCALSATIDENICKSEDPNKPYNFEDKNCLQIKKEKGYGDWNYVSFNVKYQQDHVKRILSQFWNCSSDVVSTDEGKAITVNGHSTKGRITITYTQSINTISYDRCDKILSISTNVKKGVTDNFAYTEVQISGAVKSACVVNLKSDNCNIHGRVDFVLTVRFNITVKLMCSWLTYDTITMDSIEPTLVKVENLASDPNYAHYVNWNWINGTVSNIKMDAGWIGNIISKISNYMSNIYRTLISMLDGSFKTLVLIVMVIVLFYLYIEGFSGMTIVIFLVVVLAMGVVGDDGNIEQLNSNFWVLSFLIIVFSGLFKNFVLESCNHILRRLDRVNSKITLVLTASNFIEVIKKFSLIINSFVFVASYLYLGLCWQIFVITHFISCRWFESPTIFESLVYFVLPKKFQNEEDIYMYDEKYISKAKGPNTLSFSPKIFSLRFMTPKRDALRNEHYWNILGRRCFVDVKSGGLSFGKYDFVNVLAKKLIQMFGVRETFPIVRGSCGRIHVNSGLIFRFCNHKIFNEFLENDHVCNSLDHFGGKVLKDKSNKLTYREKSNNDTFDSKTAVKYLNEGTMQFEDLVDIKPIFRSIKEDDTIDTVVVIGEDKNVRDLINQLEKVYSNLKTIVFSVWPDFRYLIDTKTVAQIRKNFDTDIILDFEVLPDITYEFVEICDKDSCAVKNTEIVKSAGVVLHAHSDEQYYKIASIIEMCGYNVWLNQEVETYEKISEIINTSKTTRDESNKQFYRIFTSTVDNVQKMTYLHENTFGQSFDLVSTLKNFVLKFQNVFTKIETTIEHETTYLENLPFLQKGVVGVGRNIFGVIGKNSSSIIDGSILTNTHCIRNRKYKIKYQGIEHLFMKIREVGSDNAIYCRDYCTKPPEVGKLYCMLFHSNNYELQKVAMYCLRTKEINKELFAMFVPMGLSQVDGFIKMRPILGTPWVGASGSPIFDMDGEIVALFGLSIIKGEPSMPGEERREVVESSLPLKTNEADNYFAQYANKVVTEEPCVTKRGFLLLAGTGSGKTTSFPMHLIKASGNKPIKILVCVPRRAACISAFNSFLIVNNTFIEDKKIKVEYRIGEKTGQDSYKAHAPTQLQENRVITFTTYGKQLAMRRNLIDNYDYILLDEFHVRDDKDVVATDLLFDATPPTAKLVVMTATDVGFASEWDKCLEEFNVSSKFRVEEKAYGEFSENKPDTFKICVDDKKERSMYPTLYIPRCQLSGRVLMFLPTIKLCNSAAKMIRKDLSGTDTEIHVFTSESPLDIQNIGKSAIIIATDVAESSITIPFVTTVIDYGLQNRVVQNLEFDSKNLEISYNYSHALTSLTESAKEQRRGRTGRTNDGIYIRAYTHSFHKVEAYPEPCLLEIAASQQLRKTFYSKFEKSKPFHPDILTKLRTYCAIIIDGDHLTDTEMDLVEKCQLEFWSMFFCPYLTPDIVEENTGKTSKNKYLKLSDDPISRNTMLKIFKHVKDYQEAKYLASYKTKTQQFKVHYQSIVHSYTEFEREFETNVVINNYTAFGISSLVFSALGLAAAMLSRHGSNMSNRHLVRADVWRKEHTQDIIASAKVPVSIDYTEDERNFLRETHTLVRDRFKSLQQGMTSMKQKIFEKTSQSVNIEDFITIRKLDLFQRSNFDPICHCISADKAMSSGIAKTIEERFHVKSLLPEKLELGSAYLTTCQIDNKANYIFNLCTKQHKGDKPCPETFETCLQDLLESLEMGGFKRLSMPWIGCGLDGLNKDWVESTIRRIFAGSGIKITIYDHNGAPTISDFDKKPRFTESFNIDQSKLGPSDIKKSQSQPNLSINTYSTGGLIPSDISMPNLNWDEIWQWIKNLFDTIKEFAVKEWTNFNAQQALGGGALGLFYDKLAEVVSRPAAFVLTASLSGFILYQFKLPKYIVFSVSTLVGYSLKRMFSSNRDALRRLTDSLGMDVLFGLTVGGAVGYYGLPKLLSPNTFQIITPTILSDRSTAANFGILDNSGYTLSSSIILAKTMMRMIDAGFGDSSTGGVAANFFEFMAQFLSAGPRAKILAAAFIAITYTTKAKIRAMKKQKVESQIQMTRSDKVADYFLQKLENSPEQFLDYLLPLMSVCVNPLSMIPVAVDAIMTYAVKTDPDMRKIFGDSLRDYGGISIITSMSTIFLKWFNALCENDDGTTRKYSAGDSISAVVGTAFCSLIDFCKGFYAYTWLRELQLFTIVSDVISMLINSALELVKRAATWLGECFTEGILSKLGISAVRDTVKGGANCVGNTVCKGKNLVVASVKSISEKVGIKTVAPDNPFDYENTSPIILPQLRFIEKTYSFTNDCGLDGFYVISEYFDYSLGMPKNLTLKRGRWERLYDCTDDRLEKEICQLHSYCISRIFIFAVRSLGLIKNYKAYELVGGDWMVRTEDALFHPKAPTDECAEEDYKLIPHILNQNVPKEDPIRYQKRGHFTHDIINMEFVPSPFWGERHARICLYQGDAMIQVRYNNIMPRDYCECTFIAFDKENALKLFKHWNIEGTGGISFVISDIDLNFKLNKYDLNVYRYKCDACNECDKFDASQCATYITTCLNADNWRDDSDKIYRREILDSLPDCTVDVNKYSAEDNWIEAIKGYIKGVSINYRINAKNHGKLEQLGGLTAEEIMEDDQSKLKCFKGFTIPLCKEKIHDLHYLNASLKVPKVYTDHDNTFKSLHNQIKILDLNRRKRGQDIWKFVRKTERYEFPDEAARPKGCCIAEQLDEATGVIKNAKIIHDPCCGTGGFGQYTTMKYKDDTKVYYYGSKIGAGFWRPNENKFKSSKDMICVDYLGTEKYSGDIRDNKTVARWAKIEPADLLVLDVGEKGSPGYESQWMKSVSGTKTHFDGMMNARKNLKKGGSMILKWCWTDEDLRPYFKKLISGFRNIAFIKIGTTSLVSKTIYIVCKQYQPDKLTIREEVLDSVYSLLILQQIDSLRYGIGRIRNLLNSYSTKYFPGTTAGMHRDWVKISGYFEEVKRIRENGDVGCVKWTYGDHSWEPRIEERMKLIVNKIKHNKPNFRVQPYNRINWQHVTGLGCFTTKVNYPKERHTVNKLIADALHTVCLWDVNNSVVGHTQSSLESIQRSLIRRLDVKPQDPTADIATRMIDGIPLMVTPEGKKYLGTLDFMAWDDVLKELNMQGSSGIFEHVPNIKEFLELPDAKDRVYQIVDDFINGRLTGVKDNLREKREPKLRKDIAPDGTLDYTTLYGNEEAIDLGKNLDPRFIQFGDIDSRIADVILLGELLKVHNTITKVYHGSLTGTPPWLMGGVLKAIWEFYNPSGSRVIDERNWVEKTGIKIETYQEMLRRGTDDFVKCICGDFSNWDATVSVFDLYVEFLFIRQFYKKSCWSALDNRFRHKVFSIVFDDYGNIFHREGQRGSGDLTTSFGNTFLNVLYHFSVQSLIEGKSMEQVLSPIGCIDFPKELTLNKMGGFDPKSGKRGRIYLFEMTHLGDGDDNLHFSTSNKIQAFLKSANYHWSKTGKIIRSGTRGGYDLANTFSEVSFCSSFYSFVPLGKNIRTRMGQFASTDFNADLDKKIIHINACDRIMYMPCRNITEVVGKLGCTMKMCTAVEPDSLRSREVTRGKLLSFLLLYGHIMLIRFFCLLMLHVIPSNGFSSEDSDGNYNLRRYNINIGKYKTIRHAIKSVYGIDDFDEMYRMDSNWERSSASALLYNVRLLRGMRPFTSLSVSGKQVVARLIKAYNIQPNTESVYLNEAIIKARLSEERALKILRN